MPKTFVAQYLDGLKTLLSELDLGAVDRVGQLLWKAYQDDRTIFIIGNGGSAATASHMACDFAKGASVEGKRRIKALSLTDNVALMTAIGNDISYEKLFTEQLVNLAQPGDVLVAYTASGNSPNIIDTLSWANGAGLLSVGILGFGGGRAKGIAQHSVVAESRNYGHVEDFHLIFEHAISQWMRQKMETDGIPA